MTYREDQRRDEELYRERTDRLTAINAADSPDRPEGFHSVDNIPEVWK